MSWSAVSSATADPMQNQVATRTRPTTSLKARSNYAKSNFSKIGGLEHHIHLLREIIILPLLYGDLYKHFNIKSPRGVIFYGPPGTGKTLLAGALANEMNKEANGKVSFYQRKGADILDKWLGESEKKLRQLFERARKTRPSVIFFDELDGLAPERSSINDQVHVSVVATLLALMDGLDDSSGVVVIGATNRLDAVDPALRRPGRFDRELYFPLPNTTARGYILEVHTSTWKHKPSPELLTQLAESTTGCCGADLQAICAEAVLCCLKRNYPNVNEPNKINIDLDSLKISAEDFLHARSNIIPSVQRYATCKMRKLTTFISPLLQRQVDRIVKHIEVLLPHFLSPTKKYNTIDSERYVGRLVLKGNIEQGLNNYVIPALLQSFEHLQINVLDVPDDYAHTIAHVFRNLPAILVLSRIDDWWDLLDNNSQMYISSMLEDMHAGLPVLLIVTFHNELPIDLQPHFIYNSSIFIELDNPNTEEREAFFKPLFFGEKCMSLWRVLHGDVKPYMIKSNKDVKEECNADIQMNLSNCITKSKLRNNKKCVKGKVIKKVKKKGLCGKTKVKWLESVYSTAIKDLTSTTASINRDIDLNKNILPNDSNSTKIINSKASMSCFCTNTDELKIYKMWKDVTHRITLDLPALQLELLYDSLLACIFINAKSFADAINALQTTLESFERTSSK